jgi:hypothetical protein
LQPSSGLALIFRPRRRRGDHSFRDGTDLLVPCRLLHLEDHQPRHFNDVALVMIVTTLIIGYSYVMELFMAWYSGDLFEQQFAQWRLTGSLWWFYPLIVICNVLLPLLFVFKRVRASLTLLFFISLSVNIGMWFERVWIVIASTAHDFLPHNWGWYFPRWPEIVILNGSICLLFLGFLLLAKYLPAAPVSDIKLDMEEERERGRTEDRRQRTEDGGQRTATRTVVLCRPSSVIRDADKGWSALPPAGELLDAVEDAGPRASRSGHLHAGADRSARALLRPGQGAPARLDLLGALSGVTVVSPWPSVRPSSRA